MGGTRTRRAVIATLAGVIGVLGPLALDRVATGRARDALARRLGRRLGAQVRISQLEVQGAFHVVLRGVTVRWPAPRPEVSRLRARRLDVSIAAGAVLGFALRVEAVEVEGVTLRWVRTDALSTLRKAVRRLRRPVRASGSRRSTAARTRISVHILRAEVRELSPPRHRSPATLLAVGGQLTRDAQGRLRGRLRMGRALLASGHGVAVHGVRWRGLQRRRGGVRTHRLRLADGQLVTPEAGASTRHFALAAQEIAPDLLQVRLAGRDLSDRAGVHLKAVVDALKHTIKGRLQLPRLSFAGLDRFVQVPGALDRRSTVGLAGDLAYSPSQGVDLKGRVRLRDLVLRDRRLAATPVRWPTVTLSGHVRVNPHGPSLRVEDLVWRQRGVSLKITGGLALRAGRVRGEARLVVPRTSCQRALEAMPRSMTRRLQGMKLAGALGGSLHFRAESADLKDLELAVSVQPAACRVIRDAPHADVNALKRPFVFVSRPPGWAPTRLVMGPERKNWVPYSRLGRNVIAAFLAAEDQRFFKHRGFDVENIRRALALDLQRGEFAKGASSISQQVVKNVFLNHRRNLSRKLQEFVLTWRLEQVLPKKRILEIYLNMVEMGPGLFGVRAAARHYFQKEPSQLDPLQAAHLAAITPNPRYYFRKFASGRAGMDWLLHLRWVLFQMHRLGWIGKREYEQYRYRDLRLISYGRRAGAGAVGQGRRGPRGRGRAGTERAAAPRPRAAGTLAADRSVE